MSDIDLLSLARCVEALPPHEFQSDQHFEVDRLIHGIVADYDCGDDEVPHYTTSVDAALLTIPDGHAVAIETGAGGALVYAHVWDDRPDYDGMPKELLHIFHRDQEIIRLPHYSASIDAAMSLVPPDMAFVLDWGSYAKVADSFFWEAFVQFKSDATNRGDAEAATPALALTAACLKARASLSRLSPPNEVKHDRD